MVHNIRPLTGKRSLTRHLAVWVETKEALAVDQFHRKRLKANRVVFWPFECFGARVEFDKPTKGGEPDDLMKKLDEPQYHKGRTTVWLARGWTDFVLSGLAEIMDAGRYSARWMTLDGSKLLVQGLLNGRPVDTTSLGCWTGGQWDDWREVKHKDTSAAYAELAGSTRSADEELFLWTIATVVIGSAAFNTGPQRLSITAQARGLWRTWLGPTVTECELTNKAGKGTATGTVRQYVAPLPSRPPVARRAERHACYGLVREQWGYGVMDGPVYAIDMTHAYLTGLLLSPVPICYVGQTGPIEPLELAQKMDRDTGVALVRLKTERAAFPYRGTGTPRRAIGQFWTWLAGAELMGALGAGFVQEVHTAHMWSCVSYNPQQVFPVMRLRNRLQEKGKFGLLAFWRGIYSALVGGWAQWRREWVDDPRVSPFGRWATWLLADDKTGELVRYRSVAGRVQKRVDKGDSPSAVPLLYAQVTAAVRALVDGAVYELPQGSVLAVLADCLWVTEEGKRSIDDHIKQARKVGAEWHIKETYDRVWMDGKGRAVVEMRGQKYPMVTGIPSYSEMGRDGRSRWQTTDPWTSPGGPNRSRGVRIGSASFDVGKFMQANRHSFLWERPWDALDLTALPERLLLPVTRRKVGDAQ